MNQLTQLTNQQNTKALCKNGVDSFKARNYDDALRYFRLMLSCDTLCSEQRSTPSQPRETLLSMNKLASDIMDLKITNHRFNRKHSNNIVPKHIYHKFDEGFNNLRGILVMDELLHIDDSVAYYNMGKTKESAGDYINALCFYFDAIQGAKKRFISNPDDHVVLVSILQSIGKIYYLFGDFAASLSAYSLALDVNKEGYDYKDNLVTASILCCIGILKYHLHCENGDKLDVIDLEESLVIMKVLVNKDHIDIATVKNNLGQCYAKQGKIDLALRTLLQALEVRCKEYGEDHQYVAATYYNMGNAQLQLFTIEALVYYSKFIKIAESKGIWYYPDVARVLHTAGDLCGRRGEYSSMINYYSKALDIEHKLYGQLDKSVLSTLNKLGTTYIEVKDYQAVKNTYKRLLDKQVEVYGTSNVIVLPTMINIAKACKELNEHEISLVTYKRVLYLQSNVLKHTKAADNFETLSSLGFLYNQKGNLSNAFFHYKEAFELSEQNAEAIEVVHVQYVLREIVDILEELDLKELKADYTLKLINFTRDDTFACHILSVVASIYKKCHKYEKALGCYRQIFDKQARRLNYDVAFGFNNYGIWRHKEIVETIYDMGEMYFMLGDRDSALQQFSKAVRLLRNIELDDDSVEDDNTFQADFIDKIANLYLLAGCENRALYMCGDASIIFRAAGLNDAQIITLIDGPSIRNDGSNHASPAA